VSYPVVGPMASRWAGEVVESPPPASGRGHARFQIELVNALLETSSMSNGVASWLGCRA
jgi:hypothetical protein